jgi:hypothetical protein
VMLPSLVVLHHSCGTTPVSGARSGLCTRAAAAATASSHCRLFDLVQLQLLLLAMANWAAAHIAAPLCVMSCEHLAGDM